MARHGAVWLAWRVNAVLGAARRGPAWLGRQGKTGETFVVASAGL